MRGASADTPGRGARADLPTDPRPGEEGAARPPMRWPAPAKLNLFLRILGRRADGRHDLQTVFQLLDFGDEVELIPRRDDRIVLLNPPPGLDAANELSVRAAHLLRARIRAGIRAHALTAPPTGVSIRLVKRIPAGAGLGGGSSNAATTLVALNRIWEAGLDDRALAALGLELGADVPVFVHGRSGWAEGVGERLLPLPLPPLWCLVVHPRVSVSTAEVFADPGLTRDSPPLKIPRPSAGRAVDVAALLAMAGNDCEPAVRLRHPVVGRVIEWLRGRVERAEWARMTGTGSAVFGVFRGEEPARRALRDLPQGWDGWVARGVAESPLRRIGRRGPARAKGDAAGAPG